MTNIMFILLAILTAVIFILYLLYQHTANKLLSSEMKNNEYEHTIVSLEAENAKLTSTLGIISKNRRKADEEINKLHNGDAVDNAIKHLSKSASHNG